MIVYVNTVSYAEHIALVKGDVSTADPVLVRMHAINVLDDVLGDRAAGRGDVLHAAMEMIGKAERGVVVVIREPRPTSLSDRVRARQGSPAPGIAIADGARSGRGGGGDQGPPQLRDYGIGAQILRDLGVQSMVLLSNARRAIIGLEGYGLSVVDIRPLPPLAR
jgi:3,4-dihydroxy 2-butanone 4-phosphate synthase / GTP cyclohydrolase II